MGQDSTTSSTSAGRPPSAAAAAAAMLHRLLLVLRAASPLPPPIHIHPRACCLLSTSTSTSTSAAFSLEDYLVTSCGLARPQAREVSKKAFHELSKASRSRPRFISAASNPDAIVALLSGAGLSRADVAAVVSAHPLLLRAPANKIASRLLALRDRVGLSAHQIARFLLVGSRALHCCDVASRLEFFVSFYGSFEQALVPAKRCGSLLTASLDRVIKPNIALLRQWGVRDIVQLCTNNARVLTFNTESLQQLLLRAQQLGVPPTSPMFRHAVAVLACNSEEKVAAKLDFFKRTLGCSESEVSTAVCKIPAILGFPDEILLRKIEFLVKEAAMEPRHIVERLVLLAYSLEKRLAPRHYVLKVLREKGLLNKKMGFYTFAKLGEETFKLRFIDYHKDSVPDLADAYATACADGLLSSCAHGLSRITSDL